ncbi:MAG: SagB/ThcOx family dehydrogenase [Bacteroidales bacterium]|nr:SagB/ThcOx family dehydrogenase [Bacteroidales bacterium]
MKTRITLLIATIALCTMAAMGQVINLPAPALNDTATLKYALENRCSHRDYDATLGISRQNLSNMLWAGWGFNREDKRTAPSALDRQEITLYVCTHQGTYRYQAEDHTLELVHKSDIMKLTGKQDFVENASINILYVCDKDLSASPEMSAVCCGAISQNIALYCASTGLKNVVRGSFDGEKLRQVLHLSGAQYILLAQSVGYPANR